MGIDIHALKVGKFLSDEWNEELEDKDNARHIFSYDFSPINHLSVFKQGVYETEYLVAPDFGMAYSGYNRFREAICRIANNCEPEEIWNNINNWVGKPFVEFINFADNEGSFDYIIAEKLYKDFSDHKEKAETHLDEYDLRKYFTYMEILKEVINNKGVIYYR